MLLYTGAGGLGGHSSHARISLACISAVVGGGIPLDVGIAFAGGSKSSCLVLVGGGTISKSCLVFILADGGGGASDTGLSGGCVSPSIFRFCCCTFSCRLCCHFANSTRPFWVCKNLWKL